MQIYRAKYKQVINNDYDDISVKAIRISSLDNETSASIFTFGAICYKKRICSVFS